MSRIGWPLVPVLKPKPAPKRRGRRDPVTPELRAAVIARDRQCVAPMICTCIASSGMRCRGRLTLDHVKDEPRLGRRAPSDERHLVTLCEGHHLDTGWATSHRPELRLYLERVAA